MNDLSSPLTDTEFERLDRFLLERIDEEAETLDTDEGVLDISELDGLFTAVVSSPVSIVPSQWLPLVWGEYEPVWESEKEFQEIFSLMIRHMNSIAHMLMEAPEHFEPAFLEREVDGRTYTIVDEWCEGYSRGVALSQEQWDQGGLEMTILLTPIRAFTSMTDFSGHDLEGNEKENVRRAIVSNVREIYAFWLARRADYMPGNQPVRRDKPRVGRNDPCPCGSGKKYKKCCLH
jgi:uncharacterized protein